jgi:hypothetical protein
MEVIMNIEKFNARVKKGFCKFPKSFANSPWFQIKKRIGVYVHPSKKNEIFSLLKKKTPLSRSLVFDLDSLCFTINTIDTFDVSLNVSKQKLLILPNIFARVASMLGQLFYKVKGYDYIIFVTSCQNLSDIKGVFTDILLIDTTPEEQKSFDRDLADDIVDVFTATTGIFINSLLEMIEETEPITASSIFDDFQSEPEYEEGKED